jgi:tRNA G18 (ribose-2'-O)-methylase SpoU
MSYENFNFLSPTMLVMGSEAHGIDTDANLISPRSTKIKIQMERPLESLNVGVAAAIVLAEVSRQRRSNAKHVLKKPSDANSGR